MQLWKMGLRPIQYTRPNLDVSSCLSYLSKKFYFSILGPIFYGKKYWRLLTLFVIISDIGPFIKDPIIFFEIFDLSSSFIVIIFYKISCINHLLLNLQPRPFYTLSRVGHKVSRKFKISWFVIRKNKRKENV